MNVSTYNATSVHMSTATSAMVTDDFPHLWIPYIVLTLFLLILAASSFVRYHVRNRGKYNARTDLTSGVKFAKGELCEVGNTYSDTSNTISISTDRQTITSICAGVCPPVCANQAVSSGDCQQSYSYTNKGYISTDIALDNNQQPPSHMKSGIP